MGLRLRAGYETNMQPNMLPSIYFSCSEQMIARETRLLTSHQIVVLLLVLQLLPLVFQYRLQGTEGSQNGVQHLFIIIVV